jgi:HPt (histidine-containing phosphotransfer) domain-containing protein
MNQLPSHKTFIFNESIDVDYINDLYAGDYEMLTETFAGVSAEYEALFQNVKACFHAKDIQALKRAVHKIKPLFGFVGLTSIQSQCQQFENSCLEASSVDLLLHDFTLLENSLIQGKKIIEEENTRLALFNSQ